MINNILFPAVNMVLVLVLAPLLDGLIRRFKAVIHSRQGPPIMQTYYDLFKLMIKEDARPTNDAVFNWTPVVCLAAMLLAAMFTPFGRHDSLGFAGDVILQIYLLSIPGIAIMLAGMSTGSPYAMLGASREMTLVLTTEPVLSIALFTMALKANSFVLSDISKWSAFNGWSVSSIVAGLAFFLAMQSEMAKVPFDIAEAETEIMEGPFVEHSGPKLALFKMALYCKVFIYASLFLDVFFPGPSLSFTLLDIVLHLFKVIAVILVVELIELVNPRLRIDQATNYFKGVAVLALFGLGFALLGL
ncbi:MAG TPA: NADH-quinone oxidoreductase subunit H [Syntrophomonadaceae bacterium]|nr:NADH-quinone oxidoreductase subunit H [Syntrophomonadaceae bacterium]